MTVILGLIGKDALVLAADQLYEGEVRTYGPKLFLHEHERDPASSALCVGGAGVADDIADARENLIERLRGKSTQRGTVAKLVKAIFVGPRSPLKNHAQDGVPIPEFLIGVKAPSELGLYEVSQTATRAVFRQTTNTFAAIGSGQAIALYLAKKLFDPRMSTEEMCALAAYIIDETKTHGAGCGGGTDIYVLPKTGRSAYYYHDQVAAAEQYYRTIYNHAHTLARTVLQSNYTEQIDRAVDRVKPLLIRAWEDFHQTNIGSEAPPPYDPDDDGPNPEDE